MEWSWALPKPGKGAGSLCNPELKAVSSCVGYPACGSEKERVLEKKVKRDSKGAAILWRITKSEDQMKTGVLLVNLGTPDSPQGGDVYKYLDEFLMDPRVMDIPWLWRQLLVRGNIVRKRFRNTSRCYAAVWGEQGSPLLFHSKKVQELLQSSLGAEYQIELAMRYQKPSLKEALERLQSSVDHFIILPLFPQYASATTGSVHQKVMEIVKEWQVIPSMSFVSGFADHPLMIQAFAAQGRKNKLEEYDRIIFSFHGLPERQLTKADATACCLKAAGCCDRKEGNRYCYKAECMRTARAIAEELKLEPHRFTIAFQSRLGKTPWTQPYLSNVVNECFEKGDRSILVFSPSFICDCLETIFEIRQEYAEEFFKKGGKRFDLVDGLNEHPLWIEALKETVLAYSCQKRKGIERGIGTKDPGAGRAAARDAAPSHL